MRILLVILTLAAPALAQTKPAAATQPYRSVQALLRECPAQNRPRRGEQWQELHQQLINKWLESMQGKAFQPTEARLIRAEMKDHGGPVRCFIELPGFDLWGLKFAMPRDRQECSTADFPENEAAKIARLKPGDPIRFEGRLKLTRIIVIYRGEAALTTRAEECRLK